MSTANSRILVIRAGRLGDTLWATAVIEPLRAHFGKGVEIDFVVMANMAPLLVDDPRIHREKITKMEKKNKEKKK
jgi:ADP-heptose:LPS heptosyltransferase